MSEWISVNDRLPEESGKYIVRAIWGSLTRRTIEEPALFKMNQRGGRFMYGFDWCTITHWMPLQPPEKS